MRGWAREGSDISSCQQWKTASQWMAWLDCRRMCWMALGCAEAGFLPTWCDPHACWSACLHRTHTQLQPRCIQSYNAAMTNTLKVRRPLDGEWRYSVFGKKLMATTCNSLAALPTLQTSAPRTTELNVAISWQTFQAYAAVNYLFDFTVSVTPRKDLAHGTGTI